MPTASMHEKAYLCENTMKLCGQMAFIVNNCYLFRPQIIQGGGYDRSGTFKLKSMGRVFSNILRLRSKARAWPLGFAVWGTLNLAIILSILVR